MPYRFLSICYLIACSDFATVKLVADEISASVVKIEVSARNPDLVRPWSKKASSSSSGSGVILDGHGILTNAHVVEYARQIFVRFDQSTDRHAARVVCFAPGMDLALLELEEKAVLEGRQGLSLRNGIPRIKDLVNVYGYPVGGDQQAVTEGIVSRIEYGSFSPGTYGLRLQIDAALNPGNSGGPAIQDGQVMGLVFSRINEAENIGYLIPAEEIERFLQDASDGTYHGKRRLFDMFQTVENDALRERLKLSDDQSGLMVTSPRSANPDHPLRPWDVVTYIGGEPIDNEGDVRVRDDLRMDFQYWIPRFLQDDGIPLTVWRDGQSVDLSVPAYVESNHVIQSLEGKYPRYFLHGPMAFMPAYRELLTALGSSGTGLLLANRNPVLQRFGEDRVFPGEELVVCRVFAHRLTKGYDNLAFVVVTHVNDHEVQNLADLVATLRDAKDEFLAFRFAGDNETIAFRRTDMEPATEDIQDEEGIRERGTRDLLQIWEEGTTTEH